MGRGGGSIEDLWAFNDEMVARAISQSRVPVISGVGHETDFTIADFTADLRAPTPTTAAELAVPNQSELQEQLYDRQERLQRTTSEFLDQQRWTLSQIHNRLQRSSPAAFLASARQKTDELSRQAERALAHRQRFELAVGIVGAVVTKGGRLVKSTRDTQIGDEINIQVRDGDFQAEVKENGE